MNKFVFNYNRMMLYAQGKWRNSRSSPTSTFGGKNKIALVIIPVFFGGLNE